MLLNQSRDYARNSVGSFMLGAGCAAVLVLSFAGAGLVLSQGSVDARKQGLNELRLDRVPRPTLTVDGLA
jgi:hypothetical protein